ncbi:hypothetical protein DID88_007591 [Monilinia fructigena]|uniref:Uncharacterized protein n=1 Tax=Monilinia fructigena TaxID=38457 RepID=A0A395J3V7_9HELO|nr:hypothetical protein DID88_007591 [Monilinia fructigena]
MQRNTKHCLIFLTLVLTCGGGVAVVFVLWLNPHNHHQPPAKRGMTDLHQHNLDIGDYPATAVATGYFGIRKSEFLQAYTSHNHQGMPSQYRDRHRSSDGEEDFGNHLDGYIVTTSIPVISSSSTQRLMSTYGNISSSTCTVVRIQATTSSNAQLLASSGVIISLTTRTVIPIAATTSSGAQSLATYSGGLGRAHKFQG